MRPAVFEHPELSAHALLDSGAGEKLERFGELVLRRPDPQALWRRRLTQREWKAADWTFVRESDRGGRWESPEGRRLPDSRAGAGTSLGLRDITARIRPTPFKHVGLFPEQASNWDRLIELAPLLGEKPRLLNLFGYTGVASAIAVRQGYSVTHVDASKTSIAWARENLEASGLPQDAVRFLVDDALAYAQRAVRRGEKYQAVLLDPPHFGRGPKGETWRFEEGLAPLLEACAELLAERSFLCLSAYSVGFSPLAFTNLLGELGAGALEAGELALPEESRPGLPTRYLPCGFCARWTRGVSGSSPLGSAL